MVINGVIFTTDLYTIMTVLKKDLLEHGRKYFYEIRDSGDDVMVCCPYHKDGQERRPSAGIRKSDGLFHCFACPEDSNTHTLPEVISHCFGTDSIGTYGWEWLLKNFATVNIENRRPIDLDIQRGKARETIQYVAEEELDSYRYYHDYMWQRKLTPKVVDIFDIGYDSKTRCLTFPVRDITGGTLFVARRSVITKFFNYPKGVDKPVYGLYELSRLREFPNVIHICESMLDATTVWVYGGFAVALNGLGNKLQFEQLNNMPNRVFCLSTDSDDAGMSARENIRKHIKGKIVKDTILPYGKKDMNMLDQEEYESLEYRL